MVRPLENSESVRVDGKEYEIKDKGDGYIVQDPLNGHRLVVEVNNPTSNERIIGQYHKQKNQLENQDPADEWDLGL